jgi:hypothetical protein
MSSPHANQLRTALASFPRSGNTWLRYLIELATGATSGSVYDDRILPRGREGIVIKTHQCNRSEFDRAIHLVRNPFDAIESYFHWKRDVQGDKAVDWEEHVRAAILEWREHTLHWLAPAPAPSEGGGRGVSAACDNTTDMRSCNETIHPPPDPSPHGRGDGWADARRTHLVRYEDLRAEPARVLRDVLTFLGCDVSEDACRSAVEQAELERMRELHPTLGERFFRKGAVGAGRHAFDDTLAGVVVETIGDLLERLGYGGEEPHEGARGATRSRPSMSLRPLLLNSVPKAGTHLVARALSLIPGMDGEYARLSPAELEPVVGEKTVDLGIGLPRPASAQRVRDVLAGLTPGRFALWHVPYSPRAADMLRQLGLAMLIIVRDPRDVVVSHAMHITNVHGHRLRRRLLQLCVGERLDIVINGLRDEFTGEVLLESLAQRYDHLLAWRAFAPSQLVRFEDLVGPQGGGCAEAQRSALRDILSFIGAPAGDETIKRIANNMFGNTITFRRGKIGGWREVLDDRHVRTIEAACGRVMRELGYEKLSAVSRQPTSAIAPGPANSQQPTVNSATPFIVNSFPKSGTKLLTKVCGMLPGVEIMAPDPRWRALSMMGEGWSSAPEFGTASAKPERPTSSDDAERILNSLPPGRFVEHHLAYSRELAELLEVHCIRMLMMVRDPRDATVSLVDYVLKAAHHPLHRFFLGLPEHERIARAITGVLHTETGGAELSDVAMRYRRRLGWLRERCVYVVRFEALVGPAGGGDAQRQREALCGLLAHIGFEPTPELVSQLAQSSFGGTRTFRHGTIGRWRSVFTAEHRALWAASAGDILEALGYDKNLP